MKRYFHLDHPFINFSSGAEQLHPLPAAAGR
jgi:hypothetical protein